MFYQPGQSARSFTARTPAASWKWGRALLAVAIVASVLCVSLLSRARAAATAGDLDPTFSGDGKLIVPDGVRDIALQPDGKIVAVSNIAVPSSPDPRLHTDFLVTRYYRDGQLDQNFGMNGKATTDFGILDRAKAVVIQPDNKIVVAGETREDLHHNSAFTMARYDSDGSPDQSFGTNGKVITYGFGTNPFSTGGNAIVLQPDGKIVAIDGGVMDVSYVLARYNSDGSLDDGTANDSTPGDSFGSGGLVTTGPQEVLGAAYDLALQPDGKIVVAGGSPDFGVARYNTDGSPDTSFDNDGVTTTDFLGGIDFAYSVALQPDGKIVLAGLASDDGQFAALSALARYNSDGSLDMSFGGDGKVTTAFLDNNRAEGVRIQPDGKIVTLGYVTDSSQSAFALARYYSNGNLDSSFGTGGKVITDFGAHDLLPQEKEQSILLQPDGKIVIAGGEAMARYLNDANSIIPPLKSLTLSPAIASECGSITGTITLSAPAPSRGVYVTLSTTNEASTVPARIKILAGETTRSFKINVMPGTTREAGSVVARLGTSIRSATLVVKPNGVSSVLFNPNPVAGTRPVTGVVELGCVAPEGGVVVTLTSRNPGIASPVQSSITIPAGARSGTFQVRTFEVSATRSAVITATANGVSKSAVLTVQ